MGHHLDIADEGRTWGQAAGILVGGESLGEIAKGGGARYNGAIDSRAAAGEAVGY
jgi:gamma-glutamyltranspeptidase / glutathione hydrolase